MQIKSNKHLLHLISKHEVGIIFPNLIPYIACNIVTQRDKSIFKPNCYSRFSNWFLWINTREGHVYWDKIDKALYTVKYEMD